MVEIGEINGGSILESWLEGQPQDVSVAISARTALRVLPIYWSWTLERQAKSRNIDALSALRRCLVASVSSNRAKSIELTQAAKRASHEFAFASEDSAAAAIRIATASASLAVSRHAVMFAVAAIVDVADVAIWQAIQTDREAVSRGQNTWRAALWPQERRANAFWNELSRRILSADNWQPGDWTFWVEWYEQMLDPVANPPNWALLEQVALIDPEIWDQGPEAVNAEIAKIQERFALRDEAAELRAQLQQAQAELAVLRQRAHNNPPELVEKSAEALPVIERVVTDLGEIVGELEKPAPDSGRLLRAGLALLEIAKALSGYGLGLGTKVVLAGAKSFGTAGGTFLADKAFNDGRLADFLTRLVNFAGG